LPNEARMKRLVAQARVHSHELGWRKEGEITFGETLECRFRGTRNYQKHRDGDVSKRKQKEGERRKEQSLIDACTS
jgi:hypothetical protein